MFPILKLIPIISVTHNDLTNGLENPTRDSMAHTTLSHLVHTTTEGWLAGPPFTNEDMREVRYPP